MRNFTFFCAVLFLANSAFAKKVGVSWANFMEARWKTDESALVHYLKKGKHEYVSRDAQASSKKQLEDLKHLVEVEKVDALIVLTSDAAVVKSKMEEYAKKIPVILYDRTMGMEGVFFVSFDNYEVGVIQAQGVVEALKKDFFDKGKTARVVMMKGNPEDGNSEVIYRGHMDTIKPYIDKGLIKIVGTSDSPGWSPENARKNFAKVMKSIDNKVDAVIASNDGTAGGIITELEKAGLAGKVPISGQDSDHAALNRIARGIQTVTVFKDARVLGGMTGIVVDKLVTGKKVEHKKFKKRKIGGTTMMDSILLKPMMITQSNLKMLIDKKWISKSVLCKGVKSGSIDVCK